MLMFILGFVLYLFIAPPVEERKAGKERKDRKEIIEGTLAKREGEQSWVTLK